MSRKTSLSHLLYIAGVIILISGCAAIRPETDPTLDKKALSFAKQAKSYNQHIITSKGTAWAILRTGTKYEKFKIAWAASFPNKIRITFLISANPIETIIATGEKITFISHTGKHSLHSYKSKDPDMKKYINIPIKMSEMILILLGRLPITKFDDTYFAPSDPLLSTIVLRQKGKPKARYLHYNDKKNCDTLWLEDYNKTLVYKMETNAYKIFGSDNIPARLEIKDNNNRKLALEITNFISNPSIKESVFRLTDHG